MSFRRQGEQVLKWVAENHFTLPVTRPVGPCRELPDWSEAKAVAQLAAVSARAGLPVENVQVLLRNAYSTWANLAELEVCKITDLDTKGLKLGRRGRFPKVKQVAVVHSQRQRSMERKLADAWFRAVVVLKAISRGHSDALDNLRSVPSAGEYSLVGRNPATR